MLNKIRVAFSERPRPNGFASINKRRHPRRAVFLDASIYAIDLFSDIVIQNVSTDGFMGEADVELNVGETVHLTLDNKAYQTGTVRWTDGHQFGVRFDTPLARMGAGDDIDFGTSEAHRPRARRATMNIPARLCLGRQPQAATVRNVSQSGMLLETDRLGSGQHILVRLGDRPPIAAVVKWENSGMVGVETAEPVGILSLVYSSG